MAQAPELNYNLFKINPMYAINLVNKTVLQVIYDARHYPYSFLYPKR